ncbi:MAG: hypothetical protein V4596_06745 [Bdellovibrionota bacterium]
MTITFNNQELLIGKIKVEFSHPISKIVEVENGIIVMLKAITKISDKNVFFVNLDGSIRWRIQDTEPSKEYSAYYTGMGLHDDGVLQVYDFTGYVCKVNLEDGTIYDREFTK